MKSMKNMKGEILTPFFMIFMLFMVAFSRATHLSCSQRLAPTISAGRRDARRHQREEDGCAPLAGQRLRTPVYMPTPAIPTVGMLPATKALNSPSSEPRCSAQTFHCSCITSHRTSIQPA